MNQKDRQDLEILMDNSESIGDFRMKLNKYIENDYSLTFLNH